MESKTINDVEKDRIVDLNENSELLTKTIPQVEITEPPPSNQSKIHGNDGSVNIRHPIEYAHSSIHRNPLKTGKYP